MLVLGVSAFYHDSAVAIVSDGNIIAASQEERYTRIKNDASFPINAMRYCLSEIDNRIHDIDRIVFYESPKLKLNRILRTFSHYAPAGFSLYMKAVPDWISEKANVKQRFDEALILLDIADKATWPPLVFSEHHLSHAASAFFPSPFDNSAVLCMDGVGESTTTSIWQGAGVDLTLVDEIRFPDSLGLLYSAMTSYVGFKVNSGEYKLMGLAPYGKPKYSTLIRDNLIDINDDGRFRLNMNYFDFPISKMMTNHKFDEIIGFPARNPESEIRQCDVDLASSIQEVTEEVVLRLASLAHELVGSDRLCLAGGVALNCVANGRLLREGPFSEVWVQPAAGDAGGALGAALLHSYSDPAAGADSPRRSGTDSMKGALLGDHFSSADVKLTLRVLGAEWYTVDEEDLYKMVAKLIAAGNVVGWFSGRMEFGPRALGARSILADPRMEDMQYRLNQKIKFRESFRPFAPAILEEHAAEWYHLDQNSPYMSYVAPLREKYIGTSFDRSHLDPNNPQFASTSVPAVTHIDLSARVQTVSTAENPTFYRLLEEFYRLTGCPMLINTSFNVRGEPIVRTPEDAFRCFMRTGMDYLVIENHVLHKPAQHEIEDIDQVDHITSD